MNWHGVVHTPASVAAGWKQPYPRETTSSHCSESTWGLKCVKFTDFTNCQSKAQLLDHGGRGAVPKCCCSSILAFMWDYFEKLRSPSSKKKKKKKSVQLAFLSLQHFWLSPKTNAHLTVSLSLIYRSWRLADSLCISSENLVPWIFLTVVAPCGR